MAKYTLMSNKSYKNNETGTVGILATDEEYIEIKAWLDENNIPDTEFPIEDMLQLDRNKEIETLKNNFIESVKVPAECIVGSITYYMDGSEDSTVRMRRGIELATLNNLSTLDIINFYNGIHKGISLDDCRIIMEQQGNFFYSRWKKFTEDRETILNDNRTINYYFN